jgi:DNA-binding CsgD family transcriptional regulator
MFGAAERMRDEIGHVFGLPERTSYDRAQEFARGKLGDVVFAEASAAGRGWPLELALARAAECLDGAPEPSLSEMTGAASMFRPVMGPALTRREREVLSLLCQRLTGVEIAERLFIGRRTVETHIENAYNKLGVDNRRDAAATAVRLGLV